MALDDNKQLAFVDQEGNTWKLTMSKMATKTNRFQLSFFFNEKEFSLSKLQSNRSAQDTWELIEKLRKTPATASKQEKGKDIGEEKENAPTVKERPKKRAKP